MRNKAKAIIANSQICSEAGATNKGIHVPRYSSMTTVSGSVPQYFSMTFDVQTPTRGVITIRKIVTQRRVHYNPSRIHGH
mgnify:FL=1